jgi:ferrous iron transport protein A
VKVETALVDLKEGQEGTISRISGGRGIRGRLRQLGLLEGQQVRKLSALAMGGPIVVRVNRAQVAIGRGMAEKVMVHPVPSPAPRP